MCVCVLARELLFAGVWGGRLLRMRECHDVMDRRWINTRAASAWVDALSGEDEVPGTDL